MFAWRDGLVQDGRSLDAPTFDNHRLAADFGCGNERVLSGHPDFNLFQSHKNFRRPSVVRLAAAQPLLEHHEAEQQLVIVLPLRLVIVQQFFHRCGF